MDRLSIQSSTRLPCWCYWRPDVGLSRPADASAAGRGLHRRRRAGRAGRAWIGQSSTEFIETLSQISIAVLLFLVGLKLDVNLVRTLGPVALATGLGQVGFTAVFGFLICTRARARLADGDLRRRGADLLFHDHHRQTPVGQARDRRAAWQDRAWFPDRAGHRRGAGDDRALGHRRRRGGGGRARSPILLRVLGFGVAMLAFVVLFIRYVADPLVERLSRAPNCW
jgi:hypothetical protein